MSERPPRKKPRTFQAYECSHLRPVVLVDGIYRHVWSGRVEGACKAGVYVVTATYEGDHYVSDLAPDDVSDGWDAQRAVSPSSGTRET